MKWKQETVKFLKLLKTKFLNFIYLFVYRQLYMKKLNLMLNKT